MSSRIPENDLYIELSTYLHFANNENIAARGQHVPPTMALNLCWEPGNKVALSPGHSHILSHSREEKLGEGLGAKLCHGPEMDSVST